MKSRDGLLVLMVIGVVGALSFVAYRYGIESPKVVRTSGEREDAPLLIADGSKDPAAAKVPVTSAGEEPDVEAAEAEAVKQAALEAAAEEAAAEEAAAAEAAAAEAAAAEAAAAEAAAAEAAAAEAAAAEAAAAEAAAAEAAAAEAAAAEAAAAEAAAAEAAAAEAAAAEAAAAEAAAAEAAAAEAAAAEAAAEAAAPKEAPSAAIETAAPPIIGGDPGLKRSGAEEETAPTVTAAPEASSGGPKPTAPSAPAASAAAPSVGSPSVDVGPAPAMESAGRPSVAEASAPSISTPSPSSPSPSGPSVSAPPAAAPAAATAEVAEARPDPNDPASYPDEPGRAFIPIDPEQPTEVAPPGIERPALGAPLVDGSEDVDAASRDSDPGDAEKGVLPAPDDPVARAARAGDESFETPASPPEPEEPAERAEDDVKPPSIERVEVERDGSGVLTGSAEPGALVTVLIDGEPDQEVIADAGGEFVVQIAAPLAPPTSIRFDLEATSEDGAVLESEGPVIVTLPADPAKPPVIVRPVADGVPIIGTITPKSEDGSIVIQTLTYGSEGEVVIQGSGTPGEIAQVYLDNGLEASARVSPDGDWRVRLGDEVAPAVYTLRVDQMSTDGIITSQAETPFQRVPSEIVLKEEGVVVVQPGNNLWTIADYVYGSGARYPVIFEGNRDKISDPDLIYPGQVLVVPELQE